MSITYLILVHQNPDQLARLVERLCAESNAKVIVHIDARVDSREFIVALDRWVSQVSFCPRRFATVWGSFASCSAALALIERAVELYTDSMLVLLSGADYPIVPESVIDQVLSERPLYMEIRPMPDDAHGKPLSRLTRFYIPPRHRKSLLIRVVNRFLRVMPPRPVGRLLRKYPPYGGASWWAMSADVARDLLAVLQRESELLRLFRHSRNSDEMFFQTLVVCAGRLGDCGPAVTRAVWREGDSPGSPATLDARGLHELLAVRGDFDLFARKFPWPDRDGLYEVVDTCVRDRY